VRRAPTWEQMLAWRQRAHYFSLWRRAKNGTSALWRALRSRDRSAAAEATGTAGLMQKRRSSGFRTTSISGAWDEHSVVEMSNQANPIEANLQLPEEAP